MSSHFLPPPLWFKTAIEIIGWAKSEKKIDDFILDCKLRPQVLGQSYSYRIDVMQELVRNELVVIAENTLTIGTSLDVKWLTEALKSGNTLAWQLVETIGNEKAIAKKFNAEELKRIGDCGEKFVVTLLKEANPEELHDQIEHVSLLDDTVGYDIKGISTQDTDRATFLEVKTTVKPVGERFEFYVSRNEFKVGKKNRNWTIVAVAIVNGEPSIIGHLYCYQFESRIPNDLDENVSWQTYKLRVERSLFRPGLP
jgi:hypothetical protein